MMLVTSPTVEAQQRPDRPTVGAIRWDAWTGGRVTVQVEKTLSPAKYHDRLPWFARVTEEGAAEIDGSPQEVMDREIDFAADAGLDYWAFLIYPAASPQSVALSQYLRSGKRGRINFCMILHGSFGVKPELWEKERDRMVALLSEPGYQRTPDGRPLVYSFYILYERAFPNERWDDFRRAAAEAGHNPYYVYMGWKPPQDYTVMSSRHGFDAVSAYAHGGAQRTFAELVQSLENEKWAAASKAGVPYIPLVTTGWDKHPRKDNPVSWELDQDYHKQEVFPSRATPEEIVAHLKRAFAFVAENPKTSPARTVILYAWNEYDEGGWLAPTRGSDGRPNTERLDALRRVLAPKP